MRMLLALILFLDAAPVFCKDLDVNTIIRRSVEANEADWKAAPGYECYEIERENKGAAKTYQQLMILGSPYRKLVAVNGKPLSLEDQETQQQKLQETIAQREQESASEREQRIAQYERERQRDHLLMEQLTDAFDFKLLGKQTLDSREAYVLQARPRPGYQPPNMESKVLTGMRGKLWIDTRDFQWVKVEAEAMRPVSMEGFLAQVEPGTRFELEKEPVAPGIWLVKHFAMKSRARMLFFFTKESQEDDTYFDYRPQSLNLPRTVPASR